MSSFKKVAVLGKGLLGSAVVEQLVIAGFEVTILSRSSSSVTNIPTGAKVVQVDYTSKESLTEALRGQDVAVVTVGSEAIPLQGQIIDASITAGVKRFIPADFGSFTTDPNARGFPIAALFASTQQYLTEKAEAGELEYTIFSVGAFLEYVFGSRLVIDVATHSAQLYDDGKHLFSTTSVAGIGKAIAGALSKPEETKNRNLFIHEALLSQVQLLAIAKKYSPAETTWTETTVSAKEELEKALKNFESNPTDFTLVFPLLKAALLGAKFASAYQKVDNELVGLPLLSEDELEKKFAEKSQSGI